MSFLQPKTAPKGDPSDPKERADFVKIFGDEMVLQAARIVEDALTQVHRGRAYFKEKDIIRSALRLAQEEIDERVLGSQHFQPLLEWAFRQHPMQVLDTRGSLTTPDMWKMEKQMLALAGEETGDHVLPEATVDDAIAACSWVSPANLPEDFLADFRKKYPGEMGPKLDVRNILRFAKASGYEVFGAGLAWNREGATGLPADAVGHPEEFLEGIEAAQREGTDWFIKPTLFLGDDWSAPAAQRLMAAAEKSGHRVLAVPREGISDEQVDAVIAAALVSRRVSVIEGTAGAGKSFTMKSVYESYKAQGYDVMGAALGWSASKVLSGSTGLPEKNCRAMEGFLRSIRKAQATGAEFFMRPTLIIVDEAGMVGTRHMHALLDMTRRSKYPVKIVLTGDSLQVAPVDAGNSMEAIIDMYGTTRIETIRRQKQESHRLAVKRFSQQRAGEALFPYIQQEGIRWSSDKNDMFNKVVQEFVSYRAAFPEKKALVLALKNDDVTELNSRIRMIYKKAGFIEAREVSLDVTDGRSTVRSGFSVGDEVVLRSNDQNLPVYYIPKDRPGIDPLDSSQWVFKTTGVFNRNAGHVVDIRRSKNPPGSYDFIIDLDGENPGRVVVNSQRFKHGEKPGMPMVHNYATTIYASQGQTVEKVLLIDSNWMNFRLSYVGASRHTESLDIYLDETDLHLRLDRMTGKADSIPLAGVDPKLIGVELGRYSRAQMLQVVASCWAQDAENMTATIFEKKHRTGMDRKKKPEGNADVRMGDPTDPVIDFIPSVNVAYPMVDVEKILQLPDPVEESEFIRPSDAEENRTSVPLYESPIRLRPNTELPVLQSLKNEGEGLFTKAVGWLSKHLLEREDEPSSVLAPHPTSPRKGAVAAGHVKPTAAFHRQVAPSATKGSPSGPKAEGSALGRLVSGLAQVITRPKGIPNLPLHSIPSPVGRIDESGVLRFDNVPQTKVPENGVPVPAPSDAFLSSVRTRLWWEQGRFGEPRVLARRGDGQVVSRYSLDGRCVVGDGFPPVAYAQSHSEEASFHIVPGPREWFLLQEIYQSKYKGTPEKVPHVIWGARDADWKFIAEDLKGKPVLIMRSRQDEGQLPWALDLQKELASRWGVTAVIVPKVPTPGVSPRAPGRRGP